MDFDNVSISRPTRGRFPVVWQRREYYYSKIIKNDFKKGTPGVGGQFIIVNSLTV